MLAMFYRVVAQAVLLFGSEMWVLSVAIETHTGFLIHIKRKRARWIADGTWEITRVEVVTEATGNQLEIKIHRETTCNHGTEGGVAENILSVCRR